MKHRVVMVWCLLVVLVVVSCTEDAPHVHSFSSAWSYDDSEHWHSSTCSHGVVSDKGPHSLELEFNEEKTEEQTKCSVCGYVASEGAHGHSFEDDYAIAAATCTSVGSKHVTCSSCGLSKVVEVQMLPHDYVDDVCSGCGALDLHVGGRGPAGGYIFYDCDADNESGNGDGLVSTTCGWRYLEAAPSDYQTNLTDPAGSITTNSEGVQMFAFGTKVGSPGQTFYLNGTSVYDSSDCTLDGLGVGQYNTRLIVESYGDSIYWCSYASSTPTAFYAAKLCDTYSVTVGSTTYDDWFLPSGEELKAMNTGLNAQGLGGFTTGGYVSSTESGDYYAKAVLFKPSYSTGSLAKTSRGVVRPARAFYSADCTRHQFVQSTVAALDCEVDGVERFTCTNCGWYYDVVTARTGHSFSDSWSHSSTEHWHSSACGHSVKADIGSHTMNLGVVVRDATSNADGIKRYSCTVCGYYYDEGIPKGTYVVGSTGPAGGIVFYVKEAASDGWQYIEAAPVSMELSGATFMYYLVGGEKSGVSGTRAYVGAGKSNTERLVSVMTGHSYGWDSDDREYYSTDYFAAKRVSEMSCSYNKKTYSDWYMPSYGELQEMAVLYRMGVGGFKNKVYLSSTEHNDSYAYGINMDTNGVYMVNKYDDESGNYLRAIRYF